MFSSSSSSSSSSCCPLRLVVTLLFVRMERRRVIKEHHPGCHRTDGDGAFLLCACAPSAENDCKDPSLADADISWGSLDGYAIIRVRPFQVWNRILLFGNIPPDQRMTMNGESVLSNRALSGVAPANQTKERSVHELFTGAFRKKSSM